MRFRRILRFTMKILRNEDFVKINPAESLQILDLSERFLETKILQIPLKPNAQVQCDLQATETGLTIRRPSA